MTLKEYLKGMFDVFVHDDHLNELSKLLNLKFGLESSL
jgi:hypothetical protein